MMFSKALERKGYFWNVQVAADHQVTVKFGKIGCTGRTILQECSSADEADSYAQAAAAKKEKAGYVSSAQASPTSVKMGTGSKKRVKNDQEVIPFPSKKKRQSARVSATAKSRTATPAKVEPTIASAKPTKSSKSKSAAETNSKTKAEKLTAKTEPTNAVVIPVDDFFPNKLNAVVVDDFDATLNQANIVGHSNCNKYYRIQLLQLSGASSPYVVWTRWGRVGEVNGSSMKELGPFESKEDAVIEFGKKFRSKTGNLWANRANFVPKKKLYVLLEIDHSKKPDDNLSVPHSLPSREVEWKTENHLPSKLDSKTQNLIDMLFEKDMFEHAMQEFDIDTRRMPLGQLTQAQVLGGVDVLKEIEEIAKTGRAGDETLAELTSRFYSVIPHDFGRRRPPIIDNAARLQKAFDMCNVLLDIETATKLMEDAERREKNSSKASKNVILPNPVDAKYDSLNADLEPVKPGSSEYAKVLRAFKETSEGGRKKLLDVWRVSRHGEDSRFERYKKMSNHKLLWHGTNIAVVAAILSSGLRIMPHSGGRCGKGIYLASECSKSQGYTSPSYKRGVACMFLAEAALGREFSILEDDSSLMAAPKAFDSVVARGRQTPSSFETITLEGEKVLLPASKPINVKAHEQSCFSQDEYLVYREEQVRLRYVLTVRFV